MNRRSCYENKVIRRGELYFVHLSSTYGSEQRGGRPAVIVSNNKNNTHSSTVEVVYCTLQEKNPLPTHVTIGEGKCAGSTVLCEQVTTVSKDKIGDYLYRLPDKVMEEIDRAIAVSLGIDYIFDEVACTKEHSADEEIRLRVKELEKENERLLDRLDDSFSADDINLIQQKVNMYKELYNNLIDRLIAKGE